MKKTGYDYIPSPGEEYYPQGKPGTGSGEDTVLARGTDSHLVRKHNGDVVVTDTSGNRRSK